MLWYHSSLHNKIQCSLITLLMIGSLDISHNHKIKMPWTSLIKRQLQKHLSSWVRESLKLLSLKTIFHQIQTWANFFQMSSNHQKWRTLCQWWISKELQNTTKWLDLHELSQIMLKLTLITQFRWIKSTNRCKLENLGRIFTAHQEYSNNLWPKLPTLKRTFECVKIL